MKLGFKKWTFTPIIIKRQEPPPIPEDIEELQAILKKDFEIIEKGEPEIFGTNLEFSVKVRCPFCKSEFTGHESSGCFHYVLLPMNCPVCGFPWRIILMLLQKCKEKKT